jgi:hypothetical protein
VLSERVLVPKLAVGASEDPARLGQNRARARGSHHVVVVVALGDHVQALLAGVGYEGGVLAERITLRPPRERTVVLTVRTARGARSSALRRSSVLRRASAERHADTPGGRIL